MNPTPPYDTLILEGGSLRCAFTAGVMDALLLLGPLPFERMLGVSAGSMVMATYLAGQYKHFYRISRDLVEDGTFIRFTSAWSKEGLMNLAHLKAHVLRHAPLDLDALAEAQIRTRAWVVTTQYDTGEPRYLEPQGREWIDVLVASASLPLVTRGKVKFRGTWMFDGGYSDPCRWTRPWNLADKTSWWFALDLWATTSPRATWIHFVPTGTGMTRRWCLCLKKATRGTTPRWIGCLKEEMPNAGHGKKSPRPFLCARTRGQWGGRSCYWTTASGWTPR